VRATYFILAGVLLLAACSGSRREPPPWLRPTEKPRDENYHGGNAAMLLRYDANHDGTVTRDELIRGLKAEFAAHDTHHNACLDAEEAAKIKAPLQLHYGGLDTRVNAGWPAFEEALKANHVKYEAFIYEGANHGFHNDTTPRYDEAAAKEAWQRTLDWFNKYLRDEPKRA